MKIWIILGVIFLALPFTSAATVKDVTLDVGGSFLLDGKNITLVNSGDKSTLLCINQEKVIVSKDKRVQNIFVDYRSSDEQKARFKLEYDCGEDCDCDEDECNNNLCIESIITKVKGNNTPEEELECTENSDCDDSDLCTSDFCTGNKCIYQKINGCGAPISGQSQDEEAQDDWFIKSLAYLLLALVILLAVISIIKIIILKRK